MLGYDVHKALYINYKIHGSLGQGSDPRVGSHVEHIWNLRNSSSIYRDIYLGTTKCMIKCP